MRYKKIASILFFSFCLAAFNSILAKDIKPAGGNQKLVMGITEEVYYRINTKRAFEFKIKGPGQLTIFIVGLIDTSRGQKKTNFKFTILRDGKKIKTGRVAGATGALYFSNTTKLFPTSPKIIKLKLPRGYYSFKILALPTNTAGGAARVMFKPGKVNIAKSPELAPLVSLTPLKKRNKHKKSRTRVAKKKTSTVEKKAISLAPLVKGHHNKRPQSVSKTNKKIKNKKSNKVAKAESLEQVKRSKKNPIFSEKEKRGKERSTTQKTEKITAYNLSKRATQKPEKRVLKGKTIKKRKKLVSLAPVLGVAFPTGGFGTVNPLFGLEVLLNIPNMKDLRAGLDIAYYPLAIEGTVAYTNSDTYKYSAEVGIIPISIKGLYRLPISFGGLNILAGGRIDVLIMSQKTSFRDIINKNSKTSIGFSATGGMEMKAGPGNAFGRLRLSYGQYNDSAVDNGEPGITDVFVGGIFFEFGYRYSL